MAGLLDDLFGGSYSGDDTTKDEYGQTQADRRKPVFSGLINAGLLAVAGGQNLMPADRAKYIAAAGGALGGIGQQQQEQQTQAAQNQLRQQQMKMSNVEMQGKQADIAQQAQWRAYAASPEFKQAMDSANASPAERMAAIAAAQKGDFKTVATVLDPKRNYPKVDAASGMITRPNGDVDIIDPLTYEPRPYMRGGQYVKPGTTQPQPTPTPNPTPQPPVVPPNANSPDIEARTRAADQEVADFSTYGTPQQPQPTAPAPPRPTVTLPPPKFANYNQDYLNSLPESIRSEVKQIAEYDRKPYSTSGVKGGLELKRNRAVMDAVQAYSNGSYTEGDFANRNFIKKQYGPGGTIGNNMISVATAHNHLGTFYDLGQALATGNNALVNRTVDEYRRTTGDPRITSFDTARLAVSDELAKAMKGANISDTEINEWKKLANSANRPDQIQAVIETAQHLLEGRSREVLDAYERRMKQPYGSFLSQQALDKQAYIKAHPLGGKPAAGAPTAPAPTGGPTQEEIAAEMARRRAAGQGQ